MLSGVGGQPGLLQAKKLTFIEQANKRQCCLRIISFIRLVDLSLKSVLHKLVYNSLTAIQKALESRSKSDMAGAGTATATAGGRSTTDRSRSGGEGAGTSSSRSRWENIRRDSQYFIFSNG